jgi:hypothetical protein
VSVDAPTGPICGAMGCTVDADVVIDHPEKGELVVCNGHAADHEVVRDAR